MLKQRPKGIDWLEILKSLAILVLTGLLDYVTGHDISFFLFYLVPIIYTLHRLGVIFALVMCVLSVFVWVFANTTEGETHIDWLSPFWSAALRFLIFALVVSLLSVRLRLKKKARQHTDALAMVKYTQRRLEQEVLEASEREQWKIGHDLHDSLCQQLTASALAGKVLANQLAAQSRPEAATANHLAGMMEQAVDLTRTLARSLRPIEMKEEGLADGLRELATSVSKTGKTLCTFECSQTVSLTTIGANTHLYRIAQEAVSNAIRDGQAKNIAMELKTEADNIILIITDDGAGLSSDAWSKDGLGRQIMNYRAGMINANLRIELLPQGGTRVTCVLPRPENFFPKTHGDEK